MSKNGFPLAQFGPLAQRLRRQIRAEAAILDGEVVAPGAAGRPIFTDLLFRRGPLAYVAFDLVWMRGDLFEARR